VALTNTEAQWVTGVSQQTGIDPRVLIAWVQSEGHPGDTAYNYLNIKTTTAASLGVPTAGTLAAGTAAFSNVQLGITAAVREINSLGLNLRGMTPEAAISQIAASPWASSHYGGPGGPKLRNTFASIFSSAALTSSYQGSGTAAAVAATANTGSASDWTSGGVSNAPGSSGSGLLPGISQAQAIADFLGKLTDPSYILRALEIIAGGVLVIVGLYLLARQVGLAPDVTAVAPAPVRAAAAAVPSTGE